MLHQASGFSAAIIIDPQGPPTTPLVEHRPLALGPTETATWIEATPGVQVRVFFTREHQFKPVVGLEAYAAYVLVDEGRPWVKIYAIGEGVQLPPNHTQPWPWFLDADLGGAAADLQETLGKKVSLKIYRCELLPGVELGYGQLYSKDVAKIDREHPVCIMNWHYASRQQLDMLGLLNGPSQADSFVPPSPLISSIAFLRHASRILLDLATPEQRVAFIERLSTSSEVLQLLPDNAQRELTAFRTGEVAPAHGAIGADSRVRRSSGGSGGGTYEGRVTRRRAAEAAGTSRARTVYVDGGGDGDESDEMHESRGL